MTGNRKILLLLAGLLLLAVLNVIGCGSSQQESSKTSDGRIEMTFWHSYNSSTAPALTAIEKSLRHAASPRQALDEAAKKCNEILEKERKNLPLEMT